MPSLDLARNQLVAFLWLFAFSVVTNNRDFSLLGSNLPGQVGYFGTLVFGAAMLCGGSRFALLAVGVTGPLALAFEPNLSNHETLYAFVCVTILAVYAARAFSERRVRVDRAPLHDTLAALFRIEFLVFYFWVAFHKLNAQFFDPAASCGVHLLDKTLHIMPALPVPPSFDQAAAPMTLMLEAAVPMLLLFPRTRRYGVLLGLGFHSVLAIGFPAFQFLVFGFLVLFVPEADLEAALARARALFQPLARAVSRPVAGLWEFLHLPWVRVVLGLIVALGVEAFAQWCRQPEYTRTFGQVTYRLALFLVCAALATAYLGLMMKGRGFGISWSIRFFPRIAPVLWLLPVALFLQGAQPHLGIKGVQSFSMYSNLDTGNGQSNHLLIPASWQISDNLNDPVFPHAGSDHRLARFADTSLMQTSILRAAKPPRLAQPYIALQRKITEMARAGATGIRIVYTRGGERRVVENAERDPELAGAGFLKRNYLFTRPIVLENPGPCRW